MIEYVTGSEFIVLMIKIIVIFGGVIGALAYLSWLERKLMARVQMRPGPTRVRRPRLDGAARSPRERPP